MKTRFDWENFYSTLMLEGLYEATRRDMDRCGFVFPEGVDDKEVRELFLLEFFPPKSERMSPADRSRVLNDTSKIIMSYINGSEACNGQEA